MRICQNRVAGVVVGSQQANGFKGLSQRAADFGTDFERAFRVLYAIFRIIEDGI